MTVRSATVQLCVWAILHLIATPRLGAIHREPGHLRDEASTRIASQGARGGTGNERRRTR
ncbi:hypothetical protein HPB50_006637 [Hyalomma asiaticum]|uniref:Uncharacterized protein n=1 Tax=Hyalomma asiaticum TaxID=266040 RepID=A0ACB7SW97_HYAAI|nr:hypothetical protein HPB50_006637 [Hyalomma asiaticum]